jgi:cobalt-zinc-cadmium resistance protein CzcA
MQGTGADNKMYNTATQFNSAQIGIGVPLFFGEQSTKIKASKIKEKIAENALLRKKSEIKIQYAEAVSKYQSKIKVIEFYEQNELKNAISLTKTALQQFSAGEINYLEWVILNNQSIIAQSGYFDAIKDLNDTIILLNYLNSNQ